MLTQERNQLPEGDWLILHDRPSVREFAVLGALGGDFGIATIYEDHSLGGSRFAFEDPEHEDGGRYAERVAEDESRNGVDGQWGWSGHTSVGVD